MKIKTIAKKMVRNYLHIDKKQFFKRDHRTKTFWFWGSYIRLEKNSKWCLESRIIAGGLLLRAVGFSIIIMCHTLLNQMLIEWISLCICINQLNTQYQLLRRTYLTSHRLHRKDWINSDKCSHCNSAPGTIKHLWWGCIFFANTLENGQNRS